MARDSGCAKQNSCVQDAVCGRQNCCPCLIHWDASSFALLHSRFAAACQAVLATGMASQRAAMVLHSLVGSHSSWVPLQLRHCAARVAKACQGCLTTAWELQLQLQLPPTAPKGLSTGPCRRRHCR